jgi:hypothetical protein
MMLESQVEGQSTSTNFQVAQPVCHDGPVQLEILGVQSLFRPISKIKELRTKIDRRPWKKTFEFKALRF